VYVTPQGNFPPEEKSIIYGGEDVQGLEFTQKGTLPEWQTHVAAPAFANPYLLLFICAAFAAILMPIVSFTSFILNLVGKSSSGKTTSLRLGNSVFGPPSRIKNWRATDNAMEWLAAAWNHALLCLDEMKQCAVQVLGKSIYMLGNEQGKERATRSGGTRKSKVWSLIAGSTSEVTSTDLLRSIGEEPMAGQEVRTIDVVISERTPHGVFHTLHGDKSGADLSDRLQRNVRQYHGTAAPAFISKVQAEGFEAVGKQVMPIVERFEAEYLPASADGQVHRVCARFGLLAAAGELASRWGVTGWPQGHAYQAIGSIFNEWLSDRGGVGAREEQKIIDQVTYYIEKYGCSRFEPLDPLTFGEYRQTPAQRAGYYRIDGGDGSMHHYVFAQTFKTEFCTGYSPKLVIKVLSEAGILKASTSQVIKDPGKKTIRVYHLVDVIAHIGDRETGGELS
jgi:putative DNA primase/helicase